MPAGGVQWVSVRAVGGHSLGYWYHYLGCYWPVYCMKWASVMAVRDECEGWVAGPWEVDVLGVRGGWAMGGGCLGRER